MNKILKEITEQMSAEYKFRADKKRISAGELGHEFARRQRNDLAFNWVLCQAPG